MESFPETLSLNGLKNTLGYRMMEEKKEGSCFSCSKFLKDSSFTFSNWKKPERMLKHGQSQNHILGMLKWMDSKRTEANKTTIVSALI